MRLVIISALALLSAACAREEDRTIAASPADEQTTDPIQTRGAEPAAPTVTVQLAPTEGNAVAGELRLTAEGEGVRVTGMVTGLEPNSVHACGVIT